MAVNISAQPISSSFQDLLLVSSSDFQNYIQTATGDVYDTFAITSSQAITASHAITASYAFYAVSASVEITKEVSSSYADEAGYAQSASGSNIVGAVALATNANTASYILASNIDGVITSASHAITADGAISASYSATADGAVSASHAIKADSADTASVAINAVFALNSTSASYADTAQSSSVAISSSHALQADDAVSASYALFATTASYALNVPDTASYALEAISASHAVNADVATNAVSASIANSANTALLATTASHALQADNSVSASLATRNILSATNDFSEITFTNGDGTTLEIDATPRQVIELVKNMDITTLPKGTPVFISGSTGNAVNVYKADAGVPSKMPASFILEQTLDPTEEGTGILSGFINGVSTIGFNDGDSVWVAVGGGYTNVKPTGSAQIQRLGNVIKGQAVNGSGLISPNEETDIPNITSGYAWVGNENQVATAVSTASFSVATASVALNANTASHALDVKEGIDVSFNSGSFNHINVDTLVATNFTATTSSVVITGDSFIQLNNDTPTQRYAGIAVVDSGSVNTTASFFFDGNTNDWNYEYEDGGAVDFGVAMFGPEYSVKGTPIYNTANTLVKADGGHHLLDSIITDDGTLVSVGGNLTANVITANTNFAGNLVGNADTATSASHALIANDAVSSSYSFNADNAVSASHAVNADNASNAISSSHAINADTAVSSSHAIQADSADNATTATTASYASNIPSTINENLTINGSTIGQVQAVIPDGGGNAVLDCANYNFFTLVMDAGTTTTISATGARAGQTINIKLTQNATPGTIAFDSQFKFEGGVDFVASVGAGDVDLLSFVCLTNNELIGTGIKNVF